MRPAAYQGRLLWRAAVHEPGRGPDDDEETPLMTDHLFESAEMAMRFARVYIKASEGQRMLLKRISTSSEQPAMNFSILVNLLELYTCKEDDDTDH